MKKVKRWTSRLIVVLLAGTLIMGSLSVSAFGAENSGDHSGSPEFIAEESVEQATDEALEAETSVHGTTETETTIEKAEVSAEEVAETVVPADDDSEAEQPVNDTVEVELSAEDAAGNSKASDSDVIKEGNNASEASGISEDKDISEKTEYISDTEGKAWTEDKNENSGKNETAAEGAAYDNTDGAEEESASRSSREASAAEQGVTEEVAEQIETEGVEETVQTDAVDAVGYQPAPYYMYNAKTLSGTNKISGVSYTDIIQFSMNGNWLGHSGEINYNLHGDYSSVSFVAGFMSGTSANATMTVIADGSTLQETVIAYDKVAKTYTFSMDGVEHLRISFNTSCYDTTYFGIAKLKFTSDTETAQYEYTSDKSFDDYNAGVRTNTSTKTGSFEMGGNIYNGGYVMSMDGNWTGHTAKINFNFQNLFKKMTFDLGFISGPRSNLTYTIEADDTVVYNSEVLPYASVPKHIVLDLTGVSGVVITVKNTAYDLNTCGIGNIKLTERYPVTKVTLNKTSADLATDSTMTLVAKVTPPNAINQTITWSSSNMAIASVDQNGVVTAKKYGTVTITASSANGKKATCKIQTRFNDVNNPGKSFYVPVYWAVNKGITVCTVIFRPEDTVTRGEFVAFLWRLAGKKKSNAKVSFTDVSSSTKFYDAIRWAVGKGIIKGYGDGTFKSERTVTRGETATMIWRYAGKPTPMTKTSPFSDIKVSNADSYKAILWGSENGIIKGSGGKFLKNDGCTRGQVVTFLYRYDQKY